MGGALFLLILLFIPCLTHLSKISILPNFSRKFSIIAETTGITIYLIYQFILDTSHVLEQGITSAPHASKRLLGALQEVGN